MSDLTDIRDQIDAIDTELLRLLNKRATLALAVGEIKSRDGLPIYAPEREMTLLRSLVERSSGPLPPTAIKAIYREIMSASLALEKDVVIVCFGTEGGPTHLAGRAKFGSSVDYAFFSDVDDAFTATSKGEGDCVVVPIEEGDHGAVKQTLDALTRTELTICGEIRVRSESSDEDDDNSSRYLVLARTATPITGNDRTTLLLRVEDRPGALVDALEPFRDASLNLAHFASRPAARGSNDVYFFIEVDGHSRDEGFDEVLRQLSRQCRAVKILGSYPKESL